MNARPYHLFFTPWGIRNGIGKPLIASSHSTKQEVLGRS
jgi:hypothetical protein